MKFLIGLLTLGVTAVLVELNQHWKISFNNNGSLIQVIEVKRDQPLWTNNGLMSNLITEEDWLTSEEELQSAAEHIIIVSMEDFRKVTQENPDIEFDVLIQHDAKERDGNTPTQYRLFDGTTLFKASMYIVPSS